MPTPNDVVAGELRAVMARDRVSTRSLAVELEQTNPMWLQRRLSGAVALTVDDLVLICEGLHVNPAELLAETLAPTT